MRRVGGFCRRELAERSGVTLVVESPGPVVARAVDGGVEQILDNLVSNALNAPVEIAAKIHQRVRKAG